MPFSLWVIVLSGLPLLCLFQAIGVCFDGDDLGMVYEAVDERDNARGVREYLVPLREWLICGDHDRFLGVPSTDDLEEQLGMSVVVGEVSEFVDDEKLGLKVPAKPSLQSGCALLCGEVAEELGSGDVQGGGQLVQGVRRSHD